MGRRTAAIEINPSVEAEPPPPESGGEGATSLFDATSDARVRILRRDDTTQKFVTHGYLPPDANEEAVSTLWGGGYYKAQLVIPDPASGKLAIKRTRDFRVPGPYKPPAKIATFEEAGHAPQNGVPSVSVAQQNNGLPATNDLMQALNAGVISSVIDLLKSMREVKTVVPQGPDPMLMKLMETQAATQQKMMEFMLTLATRDSGESKDMLGMMAKMKDLLTPPAGAVPTTNPMEMFNTMLETLTRMRETADEFATPRGGNDADPIMSSIPKLVEVVAEQHQMQKQAKAVAANPPAPPVIVGTIPTPDPNAPELPVWQKTLRQQSQRLLSSAAAKHDPDIIAGTAIVFAPPHIKEALALFFHRDEEQVTADILTEIPAMAEHREWLVEFVECMQERLFPEEFADDDDDAPEGDDDGTPRGS